LIEPYHAHHSTCHSTQKVKPKKQTFYVYCANICL